MTLVILTLNFREALAGLGGCRREVHGITYNVQWYSLTDCKTPGAGLALVQGYDDTEELEP